MLSAVLKKAEETGKLHPECCDRKGFLWDLTAAYAPGAEWRATLPEPVLLNGTIVRAASDLEALTANTK
jgi:hypothetical protein